MASNDGDRYGVPLFEARWRLLPFQLAAAALSALERRNALRGANHLSVPQSTWRYERFASPDDFPRESGMSWSSQTEDPAVEVEARLQEAWFDVSKALCASLETGRLEGFGRRNDIAGEWVAIPAVAWRLLTVQYDPGFRNWRLGHAQGGGLNLWDIRILDAVGLPLDAACLAYGPRADTAIAVRARMLRSEAPAEKSAAPPRAPLADHATRRSRKMDDVPNPDLGGDESVDPAEAARAEGVLRSSLRGQLVAGTLQSFGRQIHGEQREIAALDWRAARPDFEASTVQIGNAVLYDVVVRQRHPAFEPSTIAATRKEDESPQLKRGPRPAVIDRVAQAMRDDLKSGKTTIEQLRDEKLLALEAGYKANKESCAKARRTVLADFRN